MALSLSMHATVWCKLSAEMIAILFVLWERHCYKVRIVVFKKGFVCPFWSYFLRQHVTYLHEPFPKLKPLSQCDMLRGKQKTNSTFFIHSCTSVFIDWTPNSEAASSKNLMQVLVIMSYSSNTNSTPQRLQFVSLSKITDCHTYSLSASTSQSRIIRHLNQMCVSIEARENSILRLVQRRCVPFYLHERAREKGERRESVPLFCSLPSLTGSVWLPPARSG